MVVVQHLLKYTKIDAIRQKNMIQGSFRSLSKVILYVYVTRKANQS